jgi:hypothetical protein
MRCELVLNAFAIAFGDRFPAAEACPTTEPPSLKAKK